MTKNNHLNFLKFIDKSHFPKTITVGTDASGIEAPIHALELLNIKYDHLFSCDNDSEVIKSINANYKPKKIYTDILKRNHKELPHVDLYVAGWPCQTFSVMGKQAGFNDPNKGTIFFECWDTIRSIKPKIFILENVKGLISHDKGNTFKVIKEYLSKLTNYNIYYDIYNTLDYGLPQNRERIYIIGLDKKYFNQFHKPIPIPLNVFTDDIVDKNIKHNTIYRYN